MATSRVTLTIRLPKKLHDDLKRFVREATEDDGYKPSINRVVVQAIQSVVTPAGA